jgi:hypothetical protein
MAGLFRKLFRIGKLPDEMRPQVESEGAGARHAVGNSGQGRTGGRSAVARVPSRTLAFDVPPKFVYSVLGIPRG